MILRTCRAWLAGAVLALLSLGVAHAQDCKLVQIASFDFANRSDGMIVVPVSLEGTTVPMAIDTGATASVVDPGLAEKLHLIKSDIVEDVMFNPKGERFTQVATIHRLGIGTMHGTSIDMLVSPSLLSADGSIAGQLGSDLLRQFDVDIDFGARKLNLFSKDHCEGKVVYWPAAAVTVIPVHVVPTGQIKIPVSLDGHPFDAILDTGSANTHLRLEAAHDLFGLVPDSAGMIRVGSFGPGGIAPVYQHVFNSLALQGIAFGHPAVRIREDLARLKFEQTSQLGSRLAHVDEAKNVADLVLGTNELRNLHVYIAYKEEKLYVSAASAPAAAAAGTPKAAADTAAH